MREERITVWIKGTAPLVIFRRRLIDVWQVRNGKTVPLYGDDRKEAIKAWKASKKEVAL